MRRVADGLPKSMVIVNAAICKGCSLCVVTCPQKNFQLSAAFNRSGYHPAEFHYHGEKGECTACGICYWVCPDYAIAEVRSLKRR